MNLIVVPFHDYKKWIREGFRTRDAHLVQHFEKDERVEKVLVVNRPSSLAEIALKRQNWKTETESIVYKKPRVQLAQMSEKVYCIDILTQDFLKVTREQKTWWFTAFHYDWVIKAINDTISFLQMDEPCLFLQNPMAIGAAERLKKKYFVFDAIDNWLFHPQMENKKIIAESYRYVEENADLILTVSHALVNTFLSNPNVHWVSNGVDTDYFMQSWKATEGSKKIVGYVGKIQERVDFNLVESCLKRFPEYEFRFLGPVYSQQKRVNELKGKYKNLVFTGDIHYNDLPAQMKDFDIAIIPHRVDKFTESMNPLKLYEYLAAGKPVVSTKVAGTDSLSPYVFLADNYLSFGDLIIKALKSVSLGNLTPKEIAQSLPSECRWDVKSNTILDLIEELPD